MIINNIRNISNLYYHSSYFNLVTCENNLKTNKIQPPNINQNMFVPSANNYPNTNFSTNHFPNKMQIPNYGKLIFLLRNSMFHFTT